MNEQKAIRESWPNIQPLPTSRSHLALTRSFTEQEYGRILKGFVLEQMEDKWFLFVENDTLYVHRSWTGYCIYQLAFVKEEDGYAIGEAFVNRDESQYSSKDDEYDSKLLLFLVDRLLLGENYPLPMPANTTVIAGIETELHHHHVIGAGQRPNTQPINLTIGGMLRWFGRWLFSLIKR